MNNIGNKFGNFTIISEELPREYIRSNGKIRKVQIVKCKCECGNIKIVILGNLLNGSSKSCGCLQKIAARNTSTTFKKEEINIGDKFGKLVILKETESTIKEYRPNGYRNFLCKCECGKEKIISLSNLKKGSTKSCGCERKRLSKERSIGNKIWKGKTHSEETKIKMRSNSFYGKNSISEILNKIRSCNKYNIWRKELFIKNNYNCEISGIKGNLNAHHIINLHKLIKNNNILTLEDAYNYKELWNLDNGIVLNEKLHKQFHKLFGHYNNTKEQIEEFKQMYINKEI